MKLVRLLGLIATTMIVMVVSSCSWRANVKPSVLVIMVESLGFGAFSCGDDLQPGRPSGFQIFCEESVRFTHAYTPSVMSQATVASLLTAREPFEHGVRTNGPDALASSQITVAEVALARGYRTSFFSGGPPIWRKAGVSQGFEHFDDSISLGISRLYRPAHDVVDLFLEWQEAEAANGNFLSFLFLADLQFVDKATTNELGELRDNSYSSQVAEVDETLGQLIAELKSRKVWDSTDIVLVGLNGHPNDARLDEVPAADLFSEAARTTLMIKPARKRRDGPFHWKIDSNVSLTDVGATLFDLLGARKSPGMMRAVSLKSVLSSPQPDWRTDRRIVTESAWAQWKGVGGVRASLRQGPFLYLFDERDRLYNTLTDNMEATPLPRSDERLSELRAEFAGFLESLGYEAWKPLSRATADKIALGRELWRDREFNEAERARLLEQLRSLSRRHPDDAELREWRATWALRRDDWTELKAAAGKPVTNQAWQYIAARNLNEKVTIPEGPCWKVFEQVTTPAKSVGGAKRLPKDCEIEGLQELVTWMDDSQSEATRSRALEGFLRLYSASQLSLKISEQNQVVGKTWEAAAAVGGPSIVDLVLALPELRKQRATVRSRLAASIRLTDSRRP